MKKILLLLLGFTIGQTMAQQTCATALTITSGNHTVNAIDGTQIPNPICTDNGTGATHGKWYSYTPTQDYSITITTDLVVNSGKDTRFHVYTGSCGALNCFNGDDDAGTVGNGYLSKAIFNVFASNTYYIAFDDRWSSSGFDFQLTEGAFVVPLISFTEAIITSTSQICCVADMNADYLDDIVTVDNNQMKILTQKTTGGFNTANHALPNLTTEPSWSIATGDFDKNGFNDLVFGGGNKLTIIKAGNGGTAYTEIPYPEYIFTQRTNFIDINNDGHLDLFACHDVDQSHAYRNDGAGNLVLDIPFYATLNVGGNYQSMWTDYDNDGDQDMYMAKCRGGAPVGDAQRINLLYVNNNDGTFSEGAAGAGINDGAQSWSTAIEDFDNDGDMDFLLSNVSDENRLYRNNNDGTFTDIYATSGIDAQVGSWEVQAADFNNDGWIDFLWQNNKELYLNNGDMTFTSTDLPFSEGGLGDLNNDGFMDVQFENKVYYNVPNANNWIKVNLQGVNSNINGIGARVEVYGSFGKQIREIRSGSGFSHQSTLNAHFGIGTATEITKIIIKWPSGTIDEIFNPNKNQPLFVLEGDYPRLSNTSFENEKLSVYPNPVSDVLTLKINKNSKINSTQIFDITGRLMLSESNFTENLSVKNLASGNYLIILKDADGNKYSQKFIKK